MNQPTTNISIERLTHYTAADAAAIGRLMPHLSARLSDTPVAESTLRDIIDSPSHDQIVARDDQGAIVGNATVSIIMSSAGRTAWLNDFVVHPDTRGLGVGTKLWENILQWCKENGAKKLDFTSKRDKVAAHAFYKKHGATIRDTCYFKKDIA